MRFLTSTLMTRRRARRQRRGCALPAPCTPEAGPRRPIRVLSPPSFPSRGARRRTVSGGRPPRVSAAAPAAPAAAAPTTGYRLRLVGRADPRDGYTADVWAHRSHAYLSSWGGQPCASTGVRVYDLSRPARPRPRLDLRRRCRRPGSGGHLDGEDDREARRHARVFGRPGGDELPALPRRCVPRLRPLRRHRSGRAAPARARPHGEARFARDLASAPCECRLRLHRDHRLGDDDGRRLRRGGEHGDGTRQNRTSASTT